MLYYLYNNIGDLIGFKYNDDSYYYIKNNQDDIIGILDSSYNIVAKYTYDSWGNIISITDGNNNDVSLNNTHIANINPFRYRSYYYDKETKLYYLNSRYYNPLWGRFINADGLLVQSINLLSNNLYIYALNNPINNLDPNGKLFKKIKKLYNNWKNGMKIINNGVIKAISKVKKQVTNAWNSLKNSFVIESGVGVGVGGKAQVGPIKTEAIINKTINVGISSGKGYESTTTAAGVEAGINNTDYIFGISGEITHINDEIGNGNWEHNNPMVMPWEVWDCQNTKKILLFGTTYNEYDSIEVEDDEIFIGISIDAYFVIGGHIKIGFQF